MEKELSNLIKINFNAYQMPDFKAQKADKPWILFGEENDYPDYIIQLYQRSSKHSAIVNGKVDYIVGKGWEAVNADPKAESFIKKPNQSENLNELTSKVALDLELFNGFYLEVIQVKGGGQTISHVPFHRIRTNEDCTEFYYTKSWRKNGANNFNPDKEPDWEVIPAYDPNKKQAKSIYYYQSYTPKTSVYPVYPLPEYIGSIPYIEIDYEIANFHLNNIKKSFWGSFMISFHNGIPPQEKQKEIEQKLKKKFTGTDNAGGLIVNFDDGKENATEMNPLVPGDMDKMFDILNKTVQQEIFSGHKVTSPMLFGIKTEGQLGGRSEILEAYEIFKVTYIQNRQKQVQDVFNYLLTGDRYNEAIRLMEKAPLMQDEPIKLSEATLTSVLSREEIRNLLQKNYNVELLPSAPVAPALPAPVPVAQRQEFSADKEQVLISKFSRMGVPADNYEVLKVRKHFFKDESTLIRQCFTTTLSGRATDIQAAILKILDKTPDADYSEIAKALKISEERVKSAISDMVDAGYIEKNGRALSITESGGELVPPVENETTAIFVKYRYVKDPLVPGPELLPTSRQFCRDLIGMNKLFDRKEIEQLSKEEGYGVFLFRGGWYHNPETHETTPYCRHIWESVVVKEKR